MKKQLFTDYDIDLYEKRIDDLTDGQINDLIRRKWHKGTYATKETRAGKYIELDIYPAFHDAEKAPKRKREKKSTKAQANLNSRKAKRKLVNLVNSNFGRGDIWATFTYDEEHKPETIEGAEKAFTNFIRRINRRRKKQGKENIRYICVTEFNNDSEKKTRIHHHVIMQGDTDRDEIEKLWRNGKRNQTRRIDPDKEHGAAGIVHYISKDPKGRKRWRGSRNLKKPIITKSFTRFGRRAALQMVKDRAYLEEKIKKEYPRYRFVDASISINDISGGFYIYVQMVRD